MSGAEEHERQSDVYVRPRYPVDDPPTYCAHCSCGWTGPERYHGITDRDWDRHVAPAAEAGGELREVVARWFAGDEEIPVWDGFSDATKRAYLADAEELLALPALQRLVAEAAEVVRLRAKVARAEALAGELERNGRTIVGWGAAAAKLRRVLRGD